MDWQQILGGFATTLEPANLIFCFLGVVVGMIVGVLPGIGPLAALSLLLPLTYYMAPTASLIMLAGIFYGAQYGGSTASILMNLPGESATAVTCLDGYPMAKQGRAGVALFITTIASFVGGCIAIVLLIFFAPMIADLALRFGAAEYFAVMLFGLVAGSALSGGSFLKGLAMVGLGIVLGLVGVDKQTAYPRFLFGFRAQLFDGLSLVAVVMGLFGVAEILINLMRNKETPFTVQPVKLRSLIPTWKDIKDATLPTLRGSATGSVCGIMPGSGPTIASFIAYALERRVSRTPERFGKGAIEGVAAPEAANNAAAQAAFIPMLSLGIPGNATAAILLGAMMLHGITPGPTLIDKQAVFFWGLVASFWIGNIFLLILNIPLIGVWVSILRIPYRALYPAMLLFICIGVYSINYSVFDVYVTLLFGIVGAAMMLLGFPAAPLLLGFILGPLVEENLRNALLISRGGFEILVDSPISLVFHGASALLIAASLYGAARGVILRRRQEGRTATVKTGQPVDQA
jgi:putative tricarboxylic transport membrane protein